MDSPFSTYEADQSVTVDTAVFIIRFLPGGKITYVNDAYCRFFAKKSEDLVGSSFLTLIPEADKAAVMANIGALTVDSPMQSHDHRVIAPNGEISWHRWTNHALFDSEGNAVDYQSIGQDITPQRRAEEELANFFNLSPDMICVVAPDGRFLKINPSWAKVLGYRTEEIMATGLMDLIHPDDISTTEEEVQKQKDGKRTINFTNRFRCKDGAYRIFEWQATAEKEGLIYATARDITERKVMEDELIKMAKLESIDILAGGIAHDLNNFLTGIVGNISLARLESDPDEMDKMLANAEKEAMRVRDLTQQLLTFSSQGGMPVIKPNDIGELLRQTVNFTLSGSNLSCDFALPDDSVAADIDEGQISQVINNLIINAEQAMPEGGTITVSVERIELDKDHGMPLDKGSYVKISIEDKGVGIPAEDHQRVFDPFFSTKPKGSGLGLATSYSIIHKHNGHISMHSEVDVGTRFDIYLPASTQGIGNGKDNVTAALVRGEGSILLMDDEKVLRDLAVDLLSKVGYEVVTCKDGAEAIEKYQHAMASGKPFNAVILDLTIPGGMGGSETIKKLNRLDPDVVAIVASGYSNNSVIDDFRDYGFRGVITKPYQLTELSEVMHRVLSES